MSVGRCVMSLQIFEILEKNVRQRITTSNGFIIILTTIQRENSLPFKYSFNLLWQIIKTKTKNRLKN